MYVQIFCISYCINVNQNFNYKARDKNLDRCTDQNLRVSQGLSQKQQIQSIYCRSPKYLGALTIKLLISQ